MTPIKLLKKTALAALLSFVLVSCATVQSGMQGVQLGMNRQEVVKKLGNDFQVVSMVQTDKGGLEILRFSNYTLEAGITGYYILHFLDGKLVESHYEDINMRPGRPNRPARPR
ncbi:MAG: hypothetical protein LBL79_13875 [Prevotella sp.]|jgi:hypothetical protein|nr:hypothetical protein [Prevotella sp.]